MTRRIVDQHDTVGHRITVDAFGPGVPFVNIVRAAHPLHAYRRDHPKSRHRHTIVLDLALAIRVRDALTRWIDDTRAAQSR